MTYDSSKVFLKAAQNGFESSTGVAGALGSLAIYFNSMPPPASLHHWAIYFLKNEINTFFRGSEDTCAEFCSPFFQIHPSSRH